MRTLEKVAIFLGFLVIVVAVVSIRLTLDEEQVPDASRPAERVRAENAVHFARIESEGVETRLQTGHVIAAHHRDPAVQEPVAELVPGVDECAPRLRADDSVHR